MAGEVGGRTPGGVELLLLLSLAFTFALSLACAGNLLNYKRFIKLLLFVVVLVAGAVAVTINSPEIASSKHTHTHTHLRRKGVRKVGTALAAAGDFSILPGVRVCAAIKIAQNKRGMSRSVGLKRRVHSSQLTN